MALRDPEGSVKRRLNRKSSDSVTVSYRRTSDDVYAVTVGHGVDMPTRIADADDQLPAGEWLRLCVSTPVTIYMDLVGREPLVESGLGKGRKVALSYPQHELRTVSIP